MELSSASQVSDFMGASRPALPDPREEISLVEINRITTRVTFPNRGTPTFPNRRTTAFPARRTSPRTTLLGRAKNNNPRTPSPIRIIVHTESDHNVINTKLNIEWSSKESKIIKLFHYNDNEALKKFKIETTNTDKLSKIIDTDKPLHLVTKKFLKRLKGFVHQCFKKVKS